MNKIDRAHVLVNVCICEGFNTGARITGALEEIGFDKQHAGIILKEGTRVDPRSPNWGRTSEGIYYAPEQELPEI